MKYLVFSVVSLSILMGSCRLDSFLYNPDELEEYKFDAYEGETRFDLDPSYAIDPSLIDLFTLTSGPTDDQETIYAVYVGDKARIATDTVILYCHGNAAHMDAYWPRAKLLANLGSKNRYGVLMMDYRGYGKSSGTPTEKGLYYDVDACMEWLKGQGLTSDRLVIYGFSMGSAPATELTNKVRTLQPNKLILEAPFASSDFFAQSISKMSMPASFFNNLEIDNAEEIKTVEEPFLWLHGIEDDFVGIEHGEAIVRNYSGQKLVTRRVVGGEHSTVPIAMGLDLYSQTVLDFIEN